jgi:hypothetical protein
MDRQIEKLGFIKDFFDYLQTKLDFEDLSDYSQFSTKKVSKLWNRQRAV